MTFTVDLNQSKRQFLIYGNENQENQLSFEHRNFIFGRNGAGKTTLCDLIEEQLSDKYNVRVFKGFSNLLSENEELNGIILGEKNVEIEKEIKDLEIYRKKYTGQLGKKQEILNSLTFKSEYDDQESLPDNIESSEECREELEAKRLLNQKEKEIDEFHKKQARKIKEHNNFRISINNYDKNDFKNEIGKAKKLDEKLVKQYKELLQKEKLPKCNYSFERLLEFDPDYWINKTDDLISKNFQKPIDIEELDDSEKRKFAKLGLEIHEIGDHCAFCSGLITEDRLNLLKKFFSSVETETYKEELNDFILELKNSISEFKDMEELDKSDFNPKHKEKIDEYKLKIKEYTDNILLLLEKCKTLTQEKLNDIYNDFTKEKIQFPDFNLENQFFIELQELIVANNEEAKNFQNEKEKYKDQLRYHYIYLSLEKTDDYKEGWQGYREELNQKSLLENNYKNKTENRLKKKNELLGKEDGSEEDTISYFEAKLAEVEIKLEELRTSIKSTSKLAREINKRLKLSGKINLELVSVRNDESEIDTYKIQSTDREGHVYIRNITEISTGEKNIIAFLYFIGSLRADNNTKSKIIIFDDPMTSNDDNMQYLIIAELQRLYAGQLGSFDNNKDYLVCLTHNVHFYINVHPKFRSTDEKTIYDNNGFYYFRDGYIEKISNEKEDITNFYEALWRDLSKLYEEDLTDSMLNNMRRIIETYIHFNKLIDNQFFEGMEEHKKLFNATAHMLDDYSVNGNGKSKEEILQLFYKLFENNHAVEHFKANAPELYLNVPDSNSD
ncbi:AAA family ATPase [Aerococcus urinae]|uniref:AAA family ATPase n=1 Tax=Aerococcus urinae TaxID=1376 RepID=UPI00254E6782|nr:AAA family ATPase [Aerococcus urinae]MDK6371067.1 AAA family ATPase [Aerococcus urinae]